MKALTLTCPWAHAIAHWGKLIENRTWAPPRGLIGHRFAIHAGKSPYRLGSDTRLHIGGREADDLAEALDYARRASGMALDAPQVTNGWLHERSSSILCTARLWGWVHVAGTGSSPDMQVHDLLRDNWFVGPYGWVLTDVVTLATPVPCKGAQGLWALPPDVEAAVMGQVSP